MRWMDRLSLRVRSLLRGRRVEQELNDELEFHLNHLVEEKLAEGLPPAQARRAALREMGSLDLYREECRDARRISFVTTLAQDVRYGLRQLRRRPGFTTVAVLTLALGMGASSAIFSVVNAVLLESLPFHKPGQLVLVQERIRKLLPQPISVSAPDIRVIRNNNQVFQSVAGFASQQLNLTGAGAPARLWVARASANLMPMLGVSPLLGRFFSPAEDHPGHAVAILSYGLWRRRFGGSSSVIGRSITLDGQPWTVIGVMPRSFQFPSQGLPGFAPAEIWVPLALTPAERADIGDNFNFGVLGRLRPGVTIAQARSQLTAAAAVIQHSYGPVAASMGLKLELVATPFRQAVTGRARALMVMLLGAVGLLLLLACANVANLLLAQAAGRQKEVAVRLALGARPLRLIRQFLTESVLLALAGGLAGMILAVLLTHLLAVFAPASLPQVERIGLNLPVALFALGIAVCTGLLFGLAPALSALHTRPNQALKEGGRSEGGSSRSASARSAFIVLQVAIAVILVVGAGLLVRSFLQVEATSPGVRPRNVITAGIALPVTQYAQTAQVVAFFNDVAGGLGRVPGVMAVGASTDLPTETDWNHVYTIEEHPTPAAQKLPMAAQSLILGKDFQALGVPLVRGRLFTGAELAGHAHVVMVSVGLARKAWPGEDPIGKRLKWGPPQSHDAWLTVVGVVGDVKQAALDRPTKPHTYTPYLQSCGTGKIELGLCSALNFAVRAKLPAATSIAALRAAVRQADPALPMTGIRSLRQVLSRSIAPRVFNTFLLTVFAVAALLLAGIGLYGVLAFRVAQQTHEIGVRLALGAQPLTLVRLIAGQGLRLTLIGLAAGSLGALAFTRLLAGLLYGVKPTDPVTFAAVGLVLLGVAALASTVPALRATRVDPMQALRVE